MTSTRTLVPDQHRGDHSTGTGTEFARAVKGALGAGGTPLRRVAELLGRQGFYIAPATLSGWANGINIPDRHGYTLDRLLALERVLAAPPGELIGAYHHTDPGPWDMRHRARHPLEPRTPDADPGPEKRALDALGCVNDGVVAVVEQTEHHRVYDTRLPGHSEVRLTLVALQPDVRRYWTTFAFDDRLPGDLVPVRSCSVGGQHTVDGSGYRLRAVELRLDRALDVGETAECAFAVVFRRPRHDPGVVPPAGLFRVVSNPACRRLRLDLTFSPYQWPAEVRWVVWEQDTADRLPAAGMPVGSIEGSFRQQVTDPRLTAYGYLWRWPDALETTAPAGAR